MTDIGQRRLPQIFAIPALVAAASGVGLVAALVGDGAWDVLSWLTLAPAVALPAWYGMPWWRRRGGP